MGKHAGPERRHVKRRERQIEKGLQGRTEWRRYSICVPKGSALDQRLQMMPKGTVSEWVRLTLDRSPKLVRECREWRALADDRQRAVLGLIEDVHGLRHAAGHHSEGEVPGCASCASMGGSS